MPVFAVSISDASAFSFTAFVAGTLHTGIREKLPVTLGPATLVRFGVECELATRYQLEIPSIFKLVIFKLV